MITKTFYSFSTSSFLKYSTELSAILDNLGICILPYKVPIAILFNRLYMCMITMFYKVIVVLLTNRIHFLSSKTVDQSILQCKTTTLVCNMFFSI